MAEFVVAGIDVGNSTTEVVLARLHHGGLELVDSLNGPTWGSKGKIRSLKGAARLARRAADRRGLRLDQAVTVPMAAVEMFSTTSRASHIDHGPLRIITRGSPTGAGSAAAAGRPVPVEHLDRGCPDDVVAVVGLDTPFERAAELINRALGQRRRVVGVLIERDEAVLVGNRVAASLPIVDQAPQDVVMTMSRVALEARSDGSGLTRLCDPYWLASVFHLREQDLQSAQALGADVSDGAYAAVGLVTSSESRRSDRPSVGSGSLLRPGSTSVPEHTFALDLAEVADGAGVRRGSVRRDAVLTARLEREGGDDRRDEQARTLADELEVPVDMVGDEWEAGRVGALSTPGCPSDALVMDLGAGSIEVSTGESTRVLVGAGQMISRAVSHAHGVPWGLAELAKRGPGVLVDGPQLIVDEDLRRRFVDRPIPGDRVGRVCVLAPSGPLPLPGDLTLDEWRSWRLTLKRLVLGRGASVTRGKSSGSDAGRPIVVIGGGAGDADLAKVFRGFGTVGRADVAGGLGHRYAVAYGAVRMWCDRASCG